MIPAEPTISRIIAKPVPAVKAVLEEFVPSAEEAIEAVQAAQPSTGRVESGLQRQGAPNTPR